jgi:hypothetical protein
VTLALRIDLRADSTVPSFVMIIDDGGSFHAVDQVSGAPVPVAVDGGVFPIVTRQADLVSPAGGLAVSVAADSGRAAYPGQAGVRIAGLTVRNDSDDPTASPVRVQSLGFVPRDGAGTALADPAALISGLVVTGPTQTHFAGAPQVADSLVVMLLNPPLEVPVGQDIVLDLTGDLGAAAPLGAAWFDFAMPLVWAAEDAGNGSPVGLTVSPKDPVSGLQVVAPATELQAFGEGRLPATAGRGARDLTALTLRLVHPGSGPSAAVAWDSLELHLIDGDRDPLDPVTLLDRVRVVSGGVTLGLLADPADPDGRLGIGLVAPFLAAGDTLDVSVTLDLRPDAELIAFELVVAASGIAARDTVSGTPPTIATSGIWPILSGRSAIVVAAEDLVVGGESLMPALLAPETPYEPVLRLTLENPAPAGSGSLAVSSLALTAAGEGNDFSPLGTAVQGLAVADAVGELGRNPAVPADAGTVAITLDPPLLIAAGETREIEILVGIRSQTPTGRLRLALAEDGIGVGLPGVPPGGIRILPAAGQALPLLTEIGNVGPASLAASYINFPNPFAAGREQTTFAYYLATPARVSLRLLTPHGESVATLVAGESKTAGLHQEDAWNGLNGRGSVVRNGVYIAELVAEFTDGSRERVLRKVAVVR